jgi:dienelactone hydrolase
MSFWGELRRRNVFKVGGAYALVAWIVAQVVSVVDQPLHLPAWFATVVLVLLAIGFPVALLFAWVFELTPSGLKRSQDVGPDESVASGRKLNYLLGGLLAGAVIGSGSVWFVRRGSDDQRFLEEAIPQIEASVRSEDSSAAFEVAKKVQQRLPDSHVLAQLWPQFSGRVAIPSDPPGAKVFWRPYKSADDAWHLAGTTPIPDVRLPAGPLRLRFELDGYRTVDRTMVVFPGAMNRDGIFDATVDVRPPPRKIPIKLDRPDSLPEDMVHVPGWEEVIEGATLKFADYQLERYEVTNREYKAFVDAGGYNTPRYWQQPFVRDGKEMSFQDAMRLFADRSGRPGPSTWLGGNYPDGQDDYPVNGVSWYEAAAFAVFAGREVPTVYHWRRAINEWDSGWLLPASNMQADGPRRVGEAPGMSWAGTYDMGGNVREWVFNAIGKQRFILGGAWNEKYYSGLILNAADDPFDRSATNGFRLAVTRDAKDVMERARGPVTEPPPRDLTTFEPINDETLAIFKRLYDYDATPLDPVVEAKVEERNWTREKIVITAAYGGEKLPLYLYLPRNGRPPFQTVVFLPGANVFYLSSIEQMGFPLDFVVSNGRAVILPAYKGTLDRVDGLGPEPGWDTNVGRDRWIQIHQDMRRAIDYLETRSDIDTGALAYVGISWGSQIAPNNLVLDPRLKAAVLALAGVRLTLRFRPEIDPMNFVGRVHVPVLMLSATLDNIFPLNTSAIPFFERLGTPAANKKQVTFEAGHTVPGDIFVSETLKWLDTYLGPVL